MTNATPALVRGDAPAPAALARGSFVDGRGRLFLPRQTISVAGVVPFQGRDLPRWRERGLDPDKVYRVLRAPEEFARAARSFEGKELLWPEHGGLDTLEHPDLRVGWVQDVKFVGRLLLATAVICRHDARRAIEAGTRLYFSAGYWFGDAEMRRGVFEGEPYDARSLDLHGNHIALVIAARCGAATMVSYP